MMQMLRQLFTLEERLTLDGWAARASKVPVNPRLEWWVGVVELRDMPLPFPGETPVLLVLVDLHSAAPEPLYLNILMEGGLEEAYAVVLEFMADPEEGQPQAPARLYTPDAQTAFALGNLLRESKIMVQQGGPQELTEFLEFTRSQIVQQASQEMQVRQPTAFLTGLPDDEVRAFILAFQEFMSRRTWKILEPDKAMYAHWVNADGTAGQTYATIMGDLGSSYGVAFYPDWLSYAVQIQNSRGPDDIERILAFIGGMEAVSWGTEAEFAPQDWARLKALKLVKNGKAPSLLRMTVDGTQPPRLPVQAITGILNVLNERAAKRASPVTSLTGQSGLVAVKYPGTPRHELTEAERTGSVTLHVHNKSDFRESHLRLKAPADLLMSQLNSQAKKLLRAQYGKEAEYAMPFTFFLSASDGDVFPKERLDVWDSGGLGAGSVTLAHLARLGDLRTHYGTVQAALQAEAVPDVQLTYEVVKDTPPQTLSSSSKAKKAETITPAVPAGQTLKFGDGMCRTCGFMGNPASMTKHQATCEGRLGGSTDAFRLRVSADGPYFLDLDVKANATLDDVDSFLRGIWLECCGHMIEFSIGPQLDYDAPVLSMKKPRQPPLHTLLKTGQKFTYTYDMGTSTELEITVQARENVTPFPVTVRLLARNFAPEFKCAHPGCNQTAKWANSWEYDDWGLPVMHCTKHADKEAKADGAYLPIVNSPRMGQCAYEGGNDDKWPKGSVPLPRK